MQLHTSAFDPTGGAELVCRRGRGGLLALTAILWAVPGVLLAVKAPSFMVVLCAILPIFITPTILATWRNRGNPANWTLAASPHHVWLNLRSADHRYGPPSLSVVELDYSDLVGAARYERKFTTEDRDGPTHHTRVYLDLRLARPIPGDVGQTLDRVRRENPPERRYLGGAITVLSRATSPVEIPEPCTLRVHWAGQDQSLRPGIAKVLQALSRRIALGAPVIHADQDPESLDASSFDAYLADLARSGQRIAAVKAARRRLALSLTEAQQFVEKLEGRETR